MHCCVCSGACCHVGDPSYCVIHGGSSWTPSITTSTVWWYSGRWIGPEYVGRHRKDDAPPEPSP